MRTPSQLEKPQAVGTSQVLFENSMQKTVRVDEAELERDNVRVSSQLRCQVPTPTAYVTAIDSLTRGSKSLFQKSG